MRSDLLALVAILCLFPVVLLHSQTITTIAGTPRVFGFSGAGGPATKLVIMQPFNVVVDKGGNIFFSDPENNLIWKINTAGIASIYAGTGVYGHTGDGGPAASAQIQGGYWLSVDNADNLYFSESIGAVRKIDASGIISTVITEAQASGAGSTGDGGPLTAATFVQITRFVPDNAGNFYISDYGACVVRKVNNAGVISTIAGTGVLGFSGDGGPATAAQLNRPYGVGFDYAGNIYIPDAGNNRIRKIDAAGIITTVAGNGTMGFSGDGGPAMNAQFNGAWQVLFDADGNMYIDDAANHCVRKVDNTGTITTYAGIGGNGGYGYSGDGGPANAAKMTNVSGIAFDNGGNLYIADQENFIIRKVIKCLFARITKHPADNTVCARANTSFTMASTGATGYQWQMNSGNGWNDLKDDEVYGGTTTDNLTITSAVEAMNNTQYRCLIVNTCGTVSTVPATLTVTSSFIPTVTIATTVGAICAGTEVSFTASATNEGTTPAYQWLVNGVNTGANGTTYATSGLNDRDVVSCELTSNAVCAIPPKVVSNSITMAVNPVVTPAISIAGPGGGICAGSPASFTASTTNGGPAPVYQWQVNEVNTGTNSPTYTNSDVNDRDIVSCVLTSNAVCATRPSVASNALTITVSPVVTPAVSIATTTPIVCAGSPASFTATPTNGGAAPAYQWLVNLQPTGATGPTYVSASFNDGDAISCVMTSNAACPTIPTVASNTIVEQVQAAPGSSVSIAASATTICVGTEVSFTATPVNGGPSPAYQWQVNGKNVGPDNPLFTTSYLADGDVVSCILTSSLGCTASTPSQNQVVMSVNDNPTVVLMPDTIIGLGQSVVLQANVTGPVTSYQWTPAAGLNNPNSAAPEATPQNTTTYQVIVTTDANCTASGNVTIGVFKTLNMPNAFTPNGDGKNDLFRVPPSQPAQIRAFTVYDRRGTRVFYNSNNGAGWDGTYGGQPQPAGTYVWMIEYEDLLTKKPVQAKGTVTLIR